MKKKILSIALVVALIAIIAAGSIAYFTDKDSATNTFTIGNVKINLIESQLHRVNAGVANDATSATTPLWTNLHMDGTSDTYSQNHGWSSTYFTDAQIKADAANYSEYLATEGTGMVPGDNVRKCPYVINTGASNAYVRVRVLVPVSLFKIIDEGPSYWTSTALANGVSSKAVTAYKADTAAFLNGTATEYIVTVDNIQYYQFDFTYAEPLAPNEMTFWNCWGNIKIDPKATSDDLANVESFDVIVYADAIQADNFANATEAFTAFDAQG